MKNSQIHGLLDTCLNFIVVFSNGVFIHTDQDIMNKLTIFKDDHFYLCHYEQHTYGIYIASL